jgi:hypothetical protein
MARQRTPSTPPTTPETPTVLPLPPHVVRFFTRYAELLGLARRIAPLAASMRQDLAGLDPESRLHFSMDFDVGELDRMLAGIDWAGDQMITVLYSNASNPTLAIAGEFESSPQDTPERAFAHDLMERQAHAELGIGNANEAPNV